MRQLIDVLATGVTSSSGTVVASGTVTFYEAGTTTLATVYQDFEGSSPHSNPATLDAAGRLIAWADDRVKLLIADSAGATVREIDDVGISDEQVAAAGALIQAGDGLLSSGTEFSVAVDDSTVTIHTS